MLYVSVAFILACETTAIGFLKEYHETRKRRYFLIGLIFYVGVSFFLIKSFVYEGMGVVNVIWSAFSVIFVTTIGVVEFRERTSFMEIVGMILAVAGICVLRLHA